MQLLEVMEGEGEASSSLSLAQLLIAELKLESSQWERRLEPVQDADQDSRFLEVNSLVSFCISKVIARGHHSAVLGMIQLC